MKPRSIFIALMLAMGSPSVLAHHSRAMFNTDVRISVSGEVSRVDFVNPHAFVYVEGVTESGEVEEWGFELHSPSHMYFNGWKTDTLEVGDPVVASGNPLRSGARRIAGGGSFTLANGEVITIDSGPDTGPAPDFAEASTASESGGERNPAGPGRNMAFGATPNDGWDGLYQVAPPDGIFGPPGVLYGRMPAEIREEFGLTAASARFVPVLNEKGRTAGRAFVSDSQDNPWCSPDPYLFAHHENSYVVQIELRPDQVVLRRDGHELVVHIDGEHPPAGELFTWGYAVGQWDGEVLTIDIGNYEPNPWGIARGLPSGAQKRVTHVFSWREGRTALDVDTTMFDPEYMTAPFTIETSFFHKEDLELAPPIGCLEQTYEALRAE
ncbi:MAG: hypothetical protein F4181_10800 [Proteobacteria bacterium]|nr:hypothetical protein [Pseudomonadota bacterium]